MKKTLILGLGNTILSDDSVGCKVAVALKEQLKEPWIEVVEAGIAGLDFLELMTGFDKTIIIDAIQTKQGKPGQIYRLEPEMLSTTRHAGSPHDVSLVTSLELGRRLGLKLPQRITILAIEAADVTSFSEKCSPEVSKAVPACADIVIQELKQDGIITP